MADVTDQEIEEHHKAKGNTAPRVTVAQIDALIEASEPKYIIDPPMTLCVLTLPNGYKVIGMTASASPENYDEKMGCRLALDKCRDQLWALEGYLLKNKLAEATPEVEERPYDYSRFKEATKVKEWK